MATGGKSGGVEVVDFYNHDGRPRLVVADVDAADDSVVDNDADYYVLAVVMCFVFDKFHHDFDVDDNTIAAAAVVAFLCLLHVVVVVAQLLFPVAVVH